MTVDLWMLLAAAALQFALIMAAATPRLLLNGIPWGFGNRETESVEMPGWAVRTQKTSDNLQENLTVFAILVLVCHVAGQADGISALGTEIFVGARVVHAGIYVAGVHVARTVVWSVSVVGMALVVWAILS